MPKDPEGESYVAGKVKDLPWTQKPKHRGSVRIADCAGAIFSSHLCFSLDMESILGAV